MTNEEYKELLTEAFRAVQAAWAECLAAGDRIGCERTKALGDALAAEIAH